MEICVSYMLKRSQNRSAFTRENYKNRYFVLFPNSLTYFDGSLDKGRGKEKGSIPLRNVLTVGNVDDGHLDGYKAAFQVVYEVEGERLTLYVVAESDGMRDMWIKKIREQCSRLGTSLSRSFHPGVWNKSGYTCCNKMGKTSEGCRTVEAAPKPQQAPTDGVPEALRKLTVETPKPVAQQKQPAAAAGSKRVAMFDYSACDTSDLDLVKGEEYTIVDTSKEVWWLVKNRKGTAGYVPANYLRDVNSMEAYSWYFGNISRARSEALLKEENRDGTFLIRDSVQKPGTFTLSVFSHEGDPKSEGCVKHYHIKATGDSFFIAKSHPFKSIPDLVSYHKTNGAGLVTRLKNIANQSAPICGLGSGRWEIDPSELKLLDELGRGQFGRVRKGIWRGKTEVAVKMMDEHAMSEDDFIEEARTMTLLQHSNLVQLYGVCTKKPIFIIVEFMAGGALYSYLRRNKPALGYPNKIPQLLDMCAQVCSAMEYLEGKNVIHRDLATRNCLISTGKATCVKVCDFGLARFVSDDEYTSSSGTKFPVRWAAPEVICYTRFSTKSDVWAFGVLMWEIFSCGSLPYGQIRNREVAALIEQGKTCEKPDICPPDAYRVMKQCWALQPERRPNFKELTTILEGVQDRDYQ